MQKFIFIAGLLSSAFVCAEENKLIIRSLDNDQTCHSELHFNASESIAKKCWLSGNWNQQIKPRFNLTLRVVEGESAANKSSSNYQSTFIPQ